MKQQKLTHAQTQKVISTLKIAVKNEGSQKKFAKKLDEHQSQVSRWLSGLAIKVEKAIDIEKAFGIDREILRPDLFVRKK